MTKKIAYFLIAVGFFVSFTFKGHRAKPPFSIKPSKRSSTMEEIGYQIVDEMGDPDCFLYSYGGGNTASNPPPSCFLVCKRRFDIRTDSEYFLQAYNRLIVLLNESCIKPPAGEQFGRSNIEFTIYWEEDRPSTDRSTFGSLQNYTNNLICLKYYDASLNEIDKDIPYPTFKQLVEEKRFDEILHYGE